MEIFEEANIGPVRLKNRIIRSATFEGAADENGIPRAPYYHIYKQLAAHEVAAVITGFTYIDIKGKAMHPGQAGCDSIEKIHPFQLLTELVHGYDCKAFLQIAHTGRQTLSSVIGSQPVGASDKKSNYFNEIPHVLTTAETYGIVRQFGNAALLAQKAGFDGVQIHAAHGYLVHQFLLDSINNRKDEFKPDPETKIGTHFLQKIVEDIRDKCGQDFPVLIKISASDNSKQPFTLPQYIHLIEFLDKIQVSAIEISYGTMDMPFNIFRGDFPADCILKENWTFKKKGTFDKWIARKFLFTYLKKQLIPMKPMYNLSYAELARKKTRIPLIVVGGFRNGDQIRHAIHDCGIDFVSLCRPFISEPDLVIKLKENQQYNFRCISCNKCAVMCDSIYPTRCFNHWEQELET